MIFFLFSLQPSGSDGTCSHMVLGLHIEILFVNVGYLANPQAKVQFLRDSFLDVEYIYFINMRMMVVNMSRSSM